MARSLQYANPATCPHQRHLAFYFHQYFTGQHEEKLLCALVMVPDLGCARRQEFFNHTQLRIVHQIPAVTVVSPTVVFGVLTAHGD